MKKKNILKDIEPKALYNLVISGSKIYLTSKIDGIVTNQLITPEQAAQWEAENRF